MDGHSLLRRHWPNKNVGQVGQQGRQEDPTRGQCPPCPVPHCWNGSRSRTCEVWATAPGPSWTSKGSWQPQTWPAQTRKPCGRYGVTLARTQRELRGIACSGLREVVALKDLKQAVAIFAQRACEKLQGRSLQAGGVWVLLHANLSSRVLRNITPAKPSTSWLRPSILGRCSVSLTTDRGDVAPGLSLQECRHRPAGPDGGQCPPRRFFRSGGPAFEGAHGGHGGHGSGQREVWPWVDDVYIVGQAVARWRAAQPVWAMNKGMLSLAYTTLRDQLVRMR